MNERGARRLGERVRAERSRQPGWRSRRAFAEACGLSVRVVAALENGERANFDPETLAAVEAALGWGVGDALRVAAGREPRRQADARLARLTEMWPGLSADTQRLLVEFAEHALRR